MSQYIKQYIEIRHKRNIKRNMKQTVEKLYPYVFTVKQKGNGNIESFQYGQVVLTKEVRLN